MKIAQIASVTERVPPRKYGGTERVVYVLTEELVKRGHEVTLFASGDSITSAKLESVFPFSLRDAGITDVYQKNAINLMNIGHAYSMQEEFDIIHDHNGILSLPTATNATTPVVFTLHGALNDYTIEMYRRLKNVPLVSISDGQRHKAPDLNYIATIYNGLPLRDCPINEKREDYLLFVGRLAREKGAHIAIEVAKKSRRRLIIAAKLDTRDEEYFNTYIKDHIDNKQIVWVGEVDEETRNTLMSRAYCMIHPITWPEPFGLTLIESMACGCPVIAFSLGSIPEVIRHGKTGFVVNTPEEMVEAITHIPSIDRYFTATYARITFNEENMVERYLQVYDTIIQAHHATKRPSFIKHVPGALDTSFSTGFSFVNR